MANDDKIYEAYIGKNGNEIKNNTHKRINWILNEVKGSSYILDVGCSQGIISLLMAKEGKKVLALDIQKEAVDFANKLLKEDYKEIKDNVEFQCIDFFDFHEDLVFDTIVMSEILEHLENPSDFICHTKNYLKENGLLVITVPFGVNNHPDHNYTFYLSNIIDIIEKEFQVERVEYMGRWIGLIAKKCEKITKFNYTHEDIALLEKNFSEIDWAMTRRVEKLYSDNIRANEKYKKSIEVYSGLKEKYNNNIEKLSNLKEKYDAIKENNKKLIGEKNELSNIIETLINDLNDEIEILKENKALINKLETQKNYLKHENNEYRRKLSLITDTLVGKVCIKIYKMLKKLKNKLK